MTLLQDPFDRWLFLGAFASVTVITAWAVIGFVYEQRRRKVIAERPTQKAIPTLPTYDTVQTVIPAAYLDASDTTPAPQQMECLQCWLDDIRYPWREYRPPNGMPTFCARHAYGTLARALSAQRQQFEHRETGDKYL